MSKKGNKDNLKHREKKRRGMALVKLRDRKPRKESKRNVNLN